MRPGGGTGQPTKPPRQKREPSKSHKTATAVARGRRTSVAELQDELNALKRELHQRTRELTESLQQQSATADVLKIISQSTFDLQTVLDALVGSAASLCQADKTMVYRREGDTYHLAASHGFTDEFRQFAISHPHVTGRGTAVGRMSLEGRTIHIPDVSSDPEYTFRQGQSLGNYRTVLASRTPASSTSYVNRCSSKLPLPTFLRSSAGRPLICRQC